MAEITGMIYDIQGFSVNDGPGIRTTVFLKGCPLRCPWCHSPESQEFPTELNWMKIRCLGLDKCGKCLTICRRCLAEGTKPRINYDLLNSSNIYILGERVCFTRE